MTMEQVQIIYIILGVILCCLGWTIYWSGVKVLGMVIGMAMGMTLGIVCILILGLEKEITQAIVVGILGTVGLIAGIFLFKNLHYLFFFAMGAALGVLASSLLMDDFLRLIRIETANEIYQIIFKICIAVVSGILFVVLSKYVVVIVAAFFGTWLINSGAGDTLPDYVYIPVFLTSLVIQTGLIKSFKPPEPEKSEEEKKEKEK